MTKKRIADLLKEEVEKSNQAELAPEEAESQSAEVKADTPENTKSSSKKASSKTTASSRSRKRTTNKSTTPPPSSDDNSEALETQISELEASLQQAQQQIYDLQSDIKTHQDRIFELKDELETSKKLVAEKSGTLTKVTAELETAKETIRQITTAQEEKEQEAKTQQETYSDPQVIHGADLATNRSTLSLRNRPSSYKAIPEYAIQRGEQNSMLSDDDIGWVD